MDTQAQVRSFVQGRCGPALACAAAWQAVIHALHTAQAALTVFRAALARCDRPVVAPSDAPGLLRDWLSCQAAFAVLPDAEGDEEGYRVYLGLLRQEMDGLLGEERWSVAGLSECVAELEQCCAGYLAVADRGLGRALDRVREQVEVAGTGD